MGWLNDATVRIEGAQYLYRMPLFYNKWLDDIADTQDTSGAIADTAPFNWGNRPADPVSSSFLLLGWNLYLFYGDKTAIADHYDGFKKWEDCLLDNSKKNNTITNNKVNNCFCYCYNTYRYLPICCIEQKYFIRKLYNC